MSQLMNPMAKQIADLQTVASSASTQLTNAETIHAGLQSSIDALKARASSLESFSSSLNMSAVNNSIAILQTQASSANASLAAINSSLSDISARLLALEKKVPWVGNFTTVLPLIGIGGSFDQTVTWATPAPDATYTVVPSAAVSLTLLGSISVTVKSGSKTASGCVVTIKNGGLGVLAANVGTLDVVAVK